MGVIVKEHRPGEWWIFINYHGKRKARNAGMFKSKWNGGKRYLI